MRGIEVETIGGRAVPEVPAPREMRRLCTVAAAAAGVEDGHVAIEFVDAERIARLNAEHRGKNDPTDVLSFPIDGAQPTLIGSPPAPRELGDVVICVEHTMDVCEAVVHGVLHLVGMDHETDAGEMLALQAEILRWEAIDPQQDAPGEPAPDAGGRGPRP
jgi:probable rRNA maturation factor